VIEVMPVPCWVIRERHHEPAGDDGEVHYPSRVDAHTWLPDWQEGEDDTHAWRGELSTGHGLPVPDRRIFTVTALDAVCAQLACDTCHTALVDPDEEVTVHLRPDRIEAFAARIGWTVGGGRHTCPRCAEARVPAGPSGPGGER
jgi:hypothetical protein